MSLYNHKVKTIQGEETTLQAFQGKVLLIVNVASKCGFTKHYTGLQSTFEKYADRGFSVLGFPCNQFGSQEPGTESEIAEFCSTTYNVTFPMFAKVDVNGKEAHPLFEELKKDAKGILGSEAIKWNFTKFLVDSSGKVVKRYAPNTEPTSIQSDIEELL